MTEEGAAAKYTTRRFKYGRPEEDACTGGVAQFYTQNSARANKSNRKQSEEGPFLFFCTSALLYATSKHSFVFFSPSLDAAVWAGWLAEIFARSLSRRPRLQHDCAIHTGNGCSSAFTLAISSDCPAWMSQAGKVSIISPVTS